MSFLSARTNERMEWTYEQMEENEAVEPREQLQNEEINKFNY